MPLASPIEITRPPIAHLRPARECNSLLRTELGLAPGSGQPRFAWKWSGELIHPMRLMNDDQTPRFGWACECNPNRVHINDPHKPECSGVVSARAIWQIRNLVGQFLRVWDEEQGKSIIVWSGGRDDIGEPVIDRWVMASWLPPAPKRDWEKNYPGIEQGFYANGTFEPMNFTNPESGMVSVISLPKGQAPLVPTTKLVIAGIKEFEERRAKGAGEAEFNRAREQEEKDRKALAWDMLRDPFPMGSIPGKKNGVCWQSGTRAYDASDPMNLITPSTSIEAAQD